jgi:hypothetical protein
LLIDEIKLNAMLCYALYAMQCYSQNHPFNSPANSFFSLNECQLLKHGP